MTPGETAALDPLPYHHAVVEVLQRLEPDLWSWMASAGIAAQSAEMRHELLASTYRLDRDGHPELLAAADAAASAVGVDVPVAIYQTEGSPVPNAGLVYVPDEAIVLLSGPIAELLEPSEMTAVLGHELAHHRLWTTDSGVHLVADRLVAAMVTDDGGEVAAETARRLSLTTELFADRGALLACGELDTAVSALTKIATGTRSVVASSYLRQAEEVVLASRGDSKGTTHPETFVRAIALRDWHQGTGEAPADEFIRRMVHGDLELESLDLVEQEGLEALTRHVIAEMLTPSWMRTDATLAEARAFVPEILDLIGKCPAASFELSTSARRYVAYVLLDLATADDDLDRAPLVEALKVADRVGVQGDLADLLGPELGLSTSEQNAVLALAPPATEPDPPEAADDTGPVDDTAPPVEDDVTNPVAPVAPPHEQGAGSPSASTIVIGPPPPRRTPQDEDPS